MGHYIKSPSSNHNSSFPNLNTKTLSIPSCSDTLPHKLDHTQTSFSASSCIRGEVTACSCHYCPPNYHHLGSANIADDTWGQLENTPRNSSLTLVKNFTGFLSAQTASSAESPPLSLHATCATNISQSRLLRGDRWRNSAVCSWSHLDKSWAVECSDLELSRCLQCTSRSSGMSVLKIYSWNRGSCGARWQLSWIRAFLFI